MRLGLLGLLLLTAGAEPTELADFNWLIGEWNGVAQPKRGSAAGSWTESIDVAFTFADAATDPVGVEFTHDGSQTFESIELGAKSVAISPPGEDATVLPLARGGGRSWTFEAADQPQRLTIRKLSDIRFVLLLESRRGSRFRRQVEIGYTRAGERLAKVGVSGPQCIVTGGRGTIAVRHDGRTYYVCCSGCRQAFERHPEKIIADAKARAAQSER